MNIKAISQRAKPVASAGLVLLTLVSSVVIARSAGAPEADSRPQAAGAVVQDKYIEDSLDYKLFLHRQARLVAPNEGASR